MPAPVSVAELADILAVSRSAVRAAIKAGRISTLPDGQIDPDKAREEWVANTNPARSKVRTLGGTSGEVRAQGAQVRTEADARAAIGLIARILAGEGIPDDGKGIDFNKIRQAEMILRTHQRHLDLAIERETVMDAADANSKFYEDPRQEMNSWMAWPPRVAILMAEDLKVDPRTGKVDYRILTSVLSTYVRQHLAEMGDPEAPEWKPARSRRSA